jgi:hypothetical protein
VSPARARDAKPPKSCVKALDKAAEAFLLIDQATQASDDFISKANASAARNTGSGLGTTAISNFIADIKTYGDELKASSDSVKSDIAALTPKYKAAAAKCRKGLS